MGTGYFSIGHSTGYRVSDLGATYRPGTMAQKPRVEYAGAFYHVICRGNQRQVIFSSDADREYYLGRLEEYRHRYGFKVYAYVLMDNHVHLLIETGKVALSRIMQGLQLRYTGYYNRKYKKVGHLFQGQRASATRQAPESRRALPIYQSVSQ
jgi:putative transposase